MRFSRSTKSSLVAPASGLGLLPLELYVMGLIPPEEVPPIHILTTPNLSSPQSITAASVRAVTIGEIMQAEGGPRVPSAAQSQKDFTLAFIVTDDRPFNDAAYAYFSAMSRLMMSRDAPIQRWYYAPFYWATEDLSTDFWHCRYDSANPA